jgi:hypothetical protein
MVLSKNNEVNSRKVFYGIFGGRFIGDGAKVTIFSKKRNYLTKIFNPITTSGYF